MFWLQNCTVSRLRTVGWISAGLRMRSAQHGETVYMQLHESFNHDHALMCLVLTAHTAASFSRRLTLVRQLDSGLRILGLWDVAQCRRVDVPGVSKRHTTPLPIPPPTGSAFLAFRHQQDPQTASGPQEDKGTMIFRHVRNHQSC